MPKYKVLKSVAHNLGHSFLSDMNAIGREWTIVPEQLYQSAKANGTSEIDIDFLRQKIEPEVLRTSLIEQSLANYGRMLEDFADRQGARMSMIAEARLHLAFDFDRPFDSYDKEAEIPRLKCEVVITDDRGVSHSGRPKNWWRT